MSGYYPNKRPFDEKINKQKGIIHYVSINRRTN